MLKDRTRIVTRKAYTEFQNTFLIDYLTINVKYFDVFRVLSLFLESCENEEVCEENFVFVDKGVLNAYNHSFRFLGEKFMTINWNPEHKEFGVSINITGQGCKFLSYQCMMTLFHNLDKLQVEYDKIYEGREKEKEYQRIFNITRLDAAFDDFTGVIPVDEMLLSAEDFMINARSVSTLTYPSSVQIFSGAFNKKAYKNIEFGKRTSTGRFRLYDKRAEQKLMDVDYWYRLELELRQEKANAFMRSLLEGYDFVDIFVVFLEKMFRPIDNRYEKNGDCPSAPYWVLFIDSLSDIQEVLKIYI